MVIGSQRDVYGPGGQGVLYDEQLGSPVMYYHYHNKTSGYKTEDVYFGWNRLSFKSGWPVLVGEGDEEVEPEPTEMPQPSASTRLDVGILLSLCVLVVISVVLPC